MTRVTMNVGALDALYTQLDTLASSIEQARTAIRAAIPARIDTPSLNVGGAPSTAPEWLRQQRTDPIGTVRDLAHLLDDANGDGIVSATITGDDFTTGLETELGEQIAQEYGELPPDDPAAFATWADYLTRYGDNAAVMAGAAQVMGTPATVDVINRADAQQIDISGFATAAADEAGQNMNTALDDPAESGDWQLATDSTAVLEAINANIANGGQLSGNGAAFIETWTNTVGSENLASLSTVLLSRVPPGAPSYGAESMVNSVMNPIADSILNYSNPAVHGPTAGIDQPYQVPVGPPGPADGIIDLSEMPTAIQELTALRIGVDGDPGERLGIPPSEHEVTTRNGQTSTQYSTGETQYSQIQNLDQLNGWGALLSSASPQVEIGEGFATSVGDQALTARQDLNAIEESASSINISDTTGRARVFEPLDIDDAFSDEGMSQLLSVAARNEDAAAAMVLDDTDRRTLLLSDWDVPTGAQDIITAGTDRDPTDGGGTQDQANAALALMTDISTDPDRWLEMMPDSMEGAVVDVGLTWVDTFGMEDVEGQDSEVITGDQSQDALHRPLDFQVLLSGADRSQLMEFMAGTSTENATMFRAGMQAYGDELLTSAYADGEGDANSVNNALAWSARSGTRLDYAIVDDTLDADELANAQTVQEAIARNEDVARQRAAASIVLDLASGSIGEVIGATTTTDAGVAERDGTLFFPKPGPFLVTSGIGLVKNPLLDALFQPEEVPDFQDEELQNRYDAYYALQSEGPTASTYHQAQLLASQNPAYAASEAYGHLYGDDGQLLPLSDISGTSLDDMNNLVSDLFGDDWNGSGSIDYTQFFTTQAEQVADPRDDHLLPWYEVADNGDVTGVNEAAQEADPEGSRGELYDPATLQEALYGDNQARWDDRPEPTYTHPRRRPDPSPGTGPYDWEPTEVGVSQE